MSGGYRPVSVGEVVAVGARFVMRIGRWEFHTLPAGEILAVTLPPADQGEYDAQEPQVAFDALPDGQAQAVIQQVRGVIQTGEQLSK